MSSYAFNRVRISGPSEQLAELRGLLRTDRSDFDYANPLPVPEDEEVIRRAIVERPGILAALDDDASALEDLVEPYCLPERVLRDPSHPHHATTLAALDAAAHAERGQQLSDALSDAAKRRASGKGPEPSLTASWLIMHLVTVEMVSPVTWREAAWQTWGAGLPYHDGDPFQECLIDEAEDGTSALFAFATRWGAPLVAYAKLARRFPELTITVAFRNDWNDAVGVLTWKGDRCETLCPADTPRVDQLAELARAHDLTDVLDGLVSTGYIVLFDDEQLESDENVEQAKDEALSALESGRSVAVGLLLDETSDVLELHLGQGKGDEMRLVEVLDGLDELAVRWRGLPLTLAYRGA